MFQTKYQTDELIIKEGDPPDNFYIFETGKCRVIKTTLSGNIQQVGTIPPGGYAGELGLISGSARAASIYADDPVTAWTIDQPTYLVLLKEGHKKKREMYTTILRKVEILNILDKYQLLLIIDALHPLETQVGEVIINQGESGDAFYMIIEGYCSVSKPLTGSGEEIACIPPGGYFGERSLLLNEPRAATITSKTPCKLVKLDRNNFTRLLKPIVPKLQSLMPK